MAIPLFTVVRMVDRDDTGIDLFCVRAEGNPELVRQRESNKDCLLTGFLGSAKGESRMQAQKLADALNEAYEKFHQS